MKWPTGASPGGQTLHAICGATLWLSLWGLIGCHRDAAPTERAAESTAASGASHAGPVIGHVGGPVQPALLNGEPFRELESPDWQWMVLLFTQVDCPIANRYVPEVKRIAEDYAADGVHVVCVYPDRDETADVIAEHQEEYAVSTTAVVDHDHQLVDRFQVQVTPEVVVLDREQQVRYQGRIDDLYTDFGRGRREPRRHDLRLALDALVAGRPVEVKQTEAVGCLIVDLK